MSYFCRMGILKGKKILLGVTGGIAAYKACELLRRLQDAGAEVRVAMTPASTEFVGAMTFASLSGFPVYLAGPHTSNTFRHIDYPRWADLVLVAPASANSLARFAAGLADEPVSMCIAASLVPKVVVPAMNFAMFKSPANQRNMDTLCKDGFTIVEPGAGRLACGEEGQGRFPEVATIIDAVSKVFTEQANKPSRGKVLITVGRTEEPIDPVRIITNHSSGKTGVAIAQAFLQAGFEVLVVHGSMEAQVPAGCESVRIQSALEMHKAVLDRANDFNTLIFCAAVADYRPKKVSDQKIKDSRQQLSIELEPNPSILRDAAAKRRLGQVIVGFALETETPIEHGLAKLAKSGADLLLVNTPVRIDSGFGKDSVEYAILCKANTKENAPLLALGSKQQLAIQLVDRVSKLLANQETL